MPSGIYVHKPHSEETKLRISKGNKGKIRTSEQRKKYSLANLGNHLSEETKEKLRQLNLGKNVSLATKIKMSKAQSGEKNARWIGGVCQNKYYLSWAKNKRNRMVSKLKRQGLSHTFLEWNILKKQHNFSCLSCKKSEPEIKLTIDHIIPLSKGGLDLIQNIQPLCLKCNKSKFTKTTNFILCQNT